MGWIYPTGNESGKSDTHSPLKDGELVDSSFERQQGWKGSLVGKSICRTVMRTLGQSPSICTKSWVVPVHLAVRGGDKGTVGACWPASLEELVSFRFSEETLSQKLKWKVAERHVGL